MKSEKYFVVDVTTLLKWNRSPVGIIRTQLEFTNYLLENFQDVVNEYPKEKGKSILLTTGATERNSSKNIYDVAGNVFEWTTESISSSFRVVRGR